MTDRQEKNTTTNFRSGYVALIGQPNVGKSTLMNVLLGQKISIVTSKPQTTRHKILGILSKDNYQIIFLDTPGLLTPRYLLHKVMMKSASSAIADADLILFMIDASDVKVGKENHHHVGIETLKNLKKNIYLIINKVDLSNGDNVQSIITYFSKEYSFKKIIPISALRQSGIHELLTSIEIEIPERPPYYPLDIVSERSERFYVSEIIREKIIEKYREEVPYSVAVEIIEFKEREGRKDFISAEIYVERQSQKGILIGKSGKALKDIGELARKDIEDFLGRSVYLELHVKVRIKWKEKEQWLRRFGYYES